MVGGTIAHYQVLEKLGAGGMGEVYRARDTRLNRDVAIKALPPAFAQDPERLARFEREAQLLASLNHPNIAAIYGLERSAGQPYLILEYVPGDTLRSPLPLEEVLPILHQIIDALEEAHERGIVHRDLKPANIKVTPDGKVKVLDFGLAKALADDPAATNASNSPTLAATVLTRSAMLLGTAAYMSPEQARGKPVDKRSDIFAFGAVLYEMLTGQQAFGGETISDSLAAILKNEPDRGSLPAAASANLRRLLDRCLEKDPKRRLRDIGEARNILDEPQHPSPITQHPAQLSLVSWCLCGGIAILVLALAAISLLHFRETPPPAPDPIRFTVAPPVNGTIDTFNLSPDGRYLAMTVSMGDRRSLWIRPLDTLDLRPFAGTEDATFPFWSPDSRFIGFFAEGKLKKVSVQGGPPQTLCELPGAQSGVPQLGGTWNRDGVIVFAPQPPSGLFRVSAGGGVPVPVTKYEAGGSGTHLFPAFLPDGRHFLLLTGTTMAERLGIYVGSLASPEIRRLLPGDYQAVYAPGPSSETGHLLFVRENTLVAQPFDPVRLAFTGDLFPVAEQVRRMLRSYAGFSVSSTGALAFASGPAGGGRELAWFDRDGKRLGTVGERGAYTHLALSPDKKRLAVTREDRNNQDIWLLDLARGTASRFTSDPGLDRLPTWSPQGDRIAFLRGGPGASIFWKASSGAGAEELLWKFDATAGPLDWSRDGKSVLCVLTNPKTGADLGLVPLSGDHKPVPLIQAEFNQREARFSPDGRWVAYISDDTGRYEVYVQSMPPSGAKSQVSTGGGRQPEWRGDGRELFYIAPDRKLMAVAVAAGARFEAGVPRPLFETRIYPYSAVSGRYYDLTADGRRFLINSETVDTASTVAPITVVTNWRAAAKP